MVTLEQELRGHLSACSESLSGLRSVRGVNERVDALTLICRGVLRGSSLCVIGGSLRWFDGEIYSGVSESEVLRVLGNLLIDMGVSPSDVRRMGSMPVSVVYGEVFAPSDMVAFSNCVLDLRTGGVHDFSRDLRVVEGVGYGYDPGARCPGWEAFLQEVMPVFGERLVLQEFFGMCYVDRTRLSVEKMALFVGSGANGKSVIFEVMKGVMGNVSTLDASQLTDEKMLPYLKGRRLNFTPDMASGKDFTSALKALASGQEVTARGIFREAETVVAPPLCFAMNEIPVFRDVTDAFFRRVLLFTFSVTIPPERQDRGLAARLIRDELPGIFNWVYAGARRLVSQGGSFSRCPSMDSALACLRSDAGRSPVREWLDGNGWSVRPVYEGQAWELVGRSVIAEALGGAVSNYQITRELTQLGVRSRRSHDLEYKLYRR